LILPEPSTKGISEFTLAHIDIFVGLGAGLATFVASVMADDQEQRLKNGTFGAVAGSAIGGLAALLDNQPALLVVGFLGSAVGGLLGWLAFLLLSRSVGKPGGRNWLEYYAGGFKGLREKLHLDDQQVLLAAFDSWHINFSRLVSNQRSSLLSLPKSASTDQYAQLVIEGWLVTLVDIFALIFKTLAHKPEYQSRVTIILFGKSGGTITGKHWVAYSGSLAAHKPLGFGEDSVAYKVLKGDIQSPYYATGAEAKDKWQDRGQQSYRPFYCFRLNGNAVLSVDWPQDLKDDPTKDEFVKKAVELFQADIAPSVGMLLDRWSAPLHANVGLDPL
jgi:hypothetical protein